MLVERQRVKGILYVRSEVGVLKTVKLGEQVAEMTWYAKRPHRVPHPNAFYRHVCVAVCEVGADVRLPGVGSEAVSFPQEGKIVHVRLVDQPNPSDHARNTARRVGAAQEAEQEYLVTFAVIRRDEGIGVARDSPSPTVPPSTWSKASLVPTPE